MHGLTTPTCRVAPGERIVVMHAAGVPKRRNIVRFDVVSTVRSATVHNNDLPNILRGLRERVFAVESPTGLVQPPRPERGVFAQRLGPSVKALMRGARGCQPITSGKFLEHYKGAKRVRYAKAVQDNLEQGGPQRHHAHLSTFVKAEFINLDLKPDPAPRVIQPRHPRYNAELGRFIQPLEFRLYRRIARLCGGPTVMKGYNADQVGRIACSAWRQFDEPCAVSLDASRFDQHVSEEALRTEHAVYKAAYSNASLDERELLAKLLEWQVMNVGHARVAEGSVKYEVVGNRMSGDMNTALGNCLLMCLMVYSYCRTRGVGFRLLDNGDDATVILERRDLQTFLGGLKEWFLEMGFTMKVEEPVFTLEQIEFCQTHPVRVGDEYRMVRNPYSALSKDTCWKSPDLNSPQAASNWLRAVGECGQSLCSGVPVMQAFYQHLMRYPGRGRAQGFGDKQSGFERMEQGMSRAPVPVEATTRFSFWLAFGLTPDVQVALETKLASLPLVDLHRPWIEADSLNPTVLPIHFDC